MARTPASPLPRASRDGQRQSTCHSRYMLHAGGAPSAKLRRAASMAELCAAPDSAKRTQRGRFRAQRGLGRIGRAGVGFSRQAPPKQPPKIQGAFDYTKHSPKHLKSPKVFLLLLTPRLQEKACA